MPAPFVVQRETHIAAPPATVFAFLTDPDKILSWMGAGAQTEAHAGGLYLIKGVSGQPARVARGAFREVVPVHRLAYSFGWEGSEAVPPGSSLVEIDLIDRDGGTLLRMTPSGLPDAESVFHLAGRSWSRKLHSQAMGQPCRLSPSLYTRGDGNEHAEWKDRDRHWRVTRHRRSDSDAMPAQLQAS